MQWAEDVLERVRVLTGADTAWIVRANEADLDILSVGGKVTGRARRHVPRAGSYTDLVLRNGADLVVLDDLWAHFLNPDSRVAVLAAAAESSVSAVIRVGGAPWGVVSITSSRRPAPFTPADHELLRAAVRELERRLVADPAAPAST